MKTALTIAGSDSGGGAGIQADLKTFIAHNVYGLSAITAITAQNTVGLMAVHPVPPDFVVAQIKAVVDDIGVDVIKTGMLLNAGIVEAVVACIESLDIPYLVVDPVIMSESGERLLHEDAIYKLKTKLLQKACVVTPNRIEAEILTGKSIGSISEAREVARQIQDLGVTSVIIKGGHLPGDQVVDILFDGKNFYEFQGPRLNNRNTHGTGCTFGAAVAASLALGHSLVDATKAAKMYVAESIRHSVPIGHGRGPLNHFWNK